MSVNYNLTVLSNRLQVVETAIDAGGSNGFMQLLGASGVLSTLELARPCGVVSGDTLSFNGLSLIDPAATGTGFAIGARITNSAGTVVISGLTVGTGSPGSTSYDIFMAPTNFITAGQAIAITAATIQAH